jgi:hypothetical protein
MEIFWIELKLESKDSLIAWIWHNIELISFKPCMLGVDYLWPHWWVNLAELWLLRICLDVVLQECSLSLSAWAVLEVSISRAWCHSWLVECFHFRKYIFILYLSLKLCIRIQNLNCNKVKIFRAFQYNFLICDVLYIITSVMAPRNDPDCD